MLSDSFSAVQIFDCDIDFSGTVPYLRAWFCKFPPNNEENKVFLDDRGTFLFKVDYEHLELKVILPLPKDTTLSQMLYAVNTFAACSDICFQFNNKTPHNYFKIKTDSKAPRVRMSFVDNHGSLKLYFTKVINYWEIDLAKLKVVKNSNQIIPAIQVQLANE